MKLRNAHLAVVDGGKVVDYLLNEAHPDNGGKAQFFMSLSFSRQDPDGLIKALRAVAEHGEVVHPENRCTARNMLLTAGCQCTLKRAGGRSGRFGLSIAAGTRRGS